MTLLAGIRNLLARKKDQGSIDLTAPPDGKLAADVEIDPDVLTDDVGLVAEAAIESKPSSESAEELLGPAGPPLRMAGTGTEEDEVMAELLERIENRLDRHEDETKRLVEQMDQRVVSQTAQVQRLVSQFDERMAKQASETSRVAERIEQIEQVSQELARVKEQTTRALAVAEQQADQAGARDEAMTAALTSAVTSRVDDAVAKINEAASGGDEAMEQMSRKLDSTVQAVRKASEHSEGIAGHMRGVMETSDSLKQAMAQLSRSVETREGELKTLIARNKRSMTMFAFACTLAALMALLVAVVAMFT